ncbi:MAG TPA: HD domain-containing phosphohydrolase [Candidatus Elarobacter sp.]|jgi:putative nucleotidyltransferase with HDIG domain
MMSYALGPALVRHEQAVAGELRRTLDGADGTVLCGAIVEAFVRRAAAAGTDRGREEFLGWLREICGSYGDLAPLRGILLDAPEALARALRETLHVTLPDREVAALARDVRAVVDGAWRPLATVDDEPLDEVDAHIDAMILRLERRDPLTSEHSRAVAGWCARLGRRLGLDAADVTFAARCGLLHDIGKVVTPLEVLNAPRALDEREWGLMRAHAAAGEGIVRKAPALRPFAPAVRSHHERLDGRGYPDGLPASAIPLMARVVAVADCFNAMIGRRPYRLPLPPSRALEELVRNRGTQFDPEIVDAMIAVVDGE